MEQNSLKPFLYVMFPKMEILTDKQTEKQVEIVFSKVKYEMCDEIDQKLLA